MHDDDQGDDLRELLNSLTLTATQRALNEEATAMYEKNVYRAADYLSARGIGEQAALEHRLGVVVDPMPGHERMVGMLCLPYTSPSGVVALKFRALDPERTPKYDAPAGQHVRMYNVAALHSSGDAVMVCEGEMDAIVATHVVGIPAVGIPGASNWQPHWSRAFSDYEQVFVVADHDIAKDDKKEAPGIRHAKRVVKQLEGARLVMPPVGCDLGEWVLRDGPSAVREACGV